MSSRSSTPARQFSYRAASRPSSSAFTITTGAPASISDTVNGVPAAVIVSVGAPVGSSFPVVLPAGSWNPNPTR